MDIEQSFYSKRGRHPPALHVHMADDFDRLELMVSDRVFRRAAPLVARLRRRTLGRKGYEDLVAIMLENVLATGQVEETEQVLIRVARMWRRCPLRYCQPPIVRPHAFTRWRVALARWLWRRAR